MSDDGEGEQQTAADADGGCGVSQHDGLVGPLLDLGREASLRSTGTAVPGGCSGPRHAGREPKTKRSVMNFGHKISTSPNCANEDSDLERNIGWAI